MTTTMKTQVNATIDAIDVAQLQAIELADGWHEVKSCEFVQFAVGEAHSPITPTKFYPALRYQDRSGKTVRTPLNKVLSFSDEPR